MSVDPDLVRAVASRLPAGVAVLTVTWRGGVHAGTVSGCLVLSLEPALVGVALHADSRLREALDDVPAFTLSVLAADQGPTADWLASPGRPVVGQLERVPHHREPATGGVRLDGAAAWFDLRTVALHPVGDHDLVVGEVVAAEPGPGGGGLVHVGGRVVPLT